MSSPRPSSSESSRKRWASAALLVASLVGGLALAEIAARVYISRRQEPTGERIHASFAWRDGVLHIQPGATGWHKGYDRDRVFVTINSLGFRGPELRASPAYRIIFIGDSIVFDGGVDLPETFVAIAERDLRAEGLDVEIVNAGTTDVGIDQHLRQVEEGRFDALDPDLIVVGLYWNDSRPPQGFFGEERSLPLMKLFEMPVVDKFAIAGLARRSYILLATRYGGDVSQRFAWTDAFLDEKWRDDPAQFRALVEAARYDWGAGWEPAFEATVLPALERIAAHCERIDARLALVLFPASPQVHAQFDDPIVDAPQRQIVAFARARSIPTLDLLPDLRAHAGERVFADQCHFNVRGNAVVAEILTPFLSALARASGDSIAAPSSQLN
jgi:hypothetical protein